MKGNDVTAEEKKQAKEIMAGLEGVRMRQGLLETLRLVPWSGRSGRLVPLCHLIFKPLRLRAKKSLSIFVMRGLKMLPLSGRRLCADNFGYLNQSPMFILLMI